MAAVLGKPNSGEARRPPFWANQFQGEPDGRRFGQTNFGLSKTIEFLGQTDFGLNKTIQFLGQTDFGLSKTIQFLGQTNFG